jgi:hypothetical protein
VHGTSFAQTAPTSWLQGIWNGKCERGGKAINAQLVLAYKPASDATSGALNGRALSGITINDNTISFTEGSKTFTGTFDATFNNLAAELDKGPKAASCQLTRVIKESDSLCLLGSAKKDGYVWLNSPNGSGGGATFILRAGQHLEIRGDRTGVLCSSSTDFKPPACPVSIPQKYYSCQ